MKIKRFSPKQKRVMCWWSPKSTDRHYDAIICDGAVRSGKTLCMGLSFVCWAMTSFRGQQFAFCGKSVVSLRRNLLQELVPVLQELGFRCREKRSENLLLVSRGSRENRFYLMGGKDEGSAAFIQGVTLAGVLLDEAALMPRSFVEQAIARCSVQGSKLWFNCNPEGLNILCTKILKKLPPWKGLDLTVRIDDDPVDPHAPEGLLVLSAQLSVQRFPAACEDCSKTLRTGRRRGLLALLCRQIVQLRVQRLVILPVHL